MKKALFTEAQNFRQKWLMAVILIPLIISLWGLFQQLILGEPFGNRPASDLELTLVLLVPVLLLVFFLSLTLHTRIDREGIRYRFAPLHRHERLIKWDDVAQVYVRKYKPIAEYGGWGFRQGPGGKALNTGGNMGLQIVFKDGKKLLIGTHKSQELENILKKLDVM